jgi:amino acid transporter
MQDQQNNAGFGTLPVFLTAISTILGAILFLRFGWAVGEVGIVGVIAIVFISHLVTIPTALAVAEIATNQRVLGGGAYYIISRSFGFNIGGSIGLALYVSQAVSVAFYVIAFGEAFEPVIHYLQSEWGITFINKKIVALVTMGILSLLILKRGANLGMKALYFVVALLFLAIIMFLLGKPIEGAEKLALNETVENPKDFFYVFTIIFPAFTGLAAGLGLSGDLKDPRKSIPSGTLWATVAGLIVYLIIAYKFAISATPEQLSGDQFVMEKIALWGPIIPIGLAAASLSSALGSIMVAPRTLQAIGLDDILPGKGPNRWMAKGRSKDNEPINGSIITIIIAYFFVFIGELNFVAEIISMFFMLTYGAICLISFLEHFAADPSYRPTFKSKWYFSLIGAVLSLWLMFQMKWAYAALSLVLMSIVYIVITHGNPDKKGLAKLFKGVLFQLSRNLQIFAQRATKDPTEDGWRPFAVCISKETFHRRSAFDLMRWISHKYGFGTYIHYIKGFYNDETSRQTDETMDRLIKLASVNKNKIYMDTIVSPSFTSALAQVIQLRAVSGKHNNMILFEFSRTEPEKLVDTMNNYKLLNTAGFDVCILNTSYKGFGDHREIHVWITSEDYANANLMILLAYVMLGHPDWRKGVIRIFVLTPPEYRQQRWKDLANRVKSGRLPISLANIELVMESSETNRKDIVSHYSADADLTLIGFNNYELAGEIGKFENFQGYENMGNILFVSSNSQKEIS